MAPCSNPRISPDGTRIAYSKNNALCLVTDNGRVWDVLLDRVTCATGLFSDEQ